jgi:hypothetical protein
MELRKSKRTDDRETFYWNSLHRRDQSVLVNNPDAGISIQVKLSISQSYSTSNASLLAVGAEVES